jgi:sulfatase maturation enzyme AslB (radical SAM superfamily)
MRFESLSSAKPAEHIRSEIIDSEAAARDPSFNGETAFLSEKIALLCHRKAPVSAQQLIPENLLLRECLNPNASGLQFLEVLPNDVCNHDCIWCFTSDSRSKNVLPPGQLRARLEGFITHGGQSVLLSGGGEPLFYRPLTEPQAEFDNDTAVGWLAANGIAVGL